MSERAPLSFLIVQHKDENPPVEPVVPFAAQCGAVEDFVIVTAILERTAAFHAVSDRYDTGVTRLENVLVDPSTIAWRARTADYDGTRIAAVHYGKPGQRFRVHADTTREEQRRAGDERALRNRQEVEASTARELKASLKRSRQEAQENAMPEVLKHCPGCKQDKPKSEFPSGKGFFYCRECRAQKSEKPADKIAQEVTSDPAIPAPERRGNKVEGHIVQPPEGMKFCAHCTTDKPLSEFGLNKKKADGRQSICRSCRSDIWTAGSTAMGHVKAAKNGDIGAQLKVLIASLRKKLGDLESENERLKEELAGVNGQLEELLA